MKFFGEVFVTLLVITDPAGTVPLFIALTRGREPRERHRLAWQAALVAFGVILAFALAGRARSSPPCCSSSGSIMGHRWPVSRSPCAP
ncbi:MAG: MarC family protein [Streptosporangiaceae bacterium]